MTGSHARQRGQAQGKRTATDKLVGRAVMEFGIAPAIVMDLSGIVRELNDAAVTLLLVQRDAVIGRELAEALIPDERRGAHRRALEQYRTTGRSEMLGRPLELTFLRGDGTPLVLGVSMAVVGSGEAAAVVAVLGDLGRRSPDLPSLVEPQRLLAYAESIAGVGSIELELESGDVAWSEGVYRVLGIEPEMPPQSLADTIASFVHPDDRARARRTTRRIMRERPERVRQRLRIIRPDGVERAVELNWRLDRNEYREPTRFIGTVRDVTDVLRARADREMLSYVVDSSEDAIFTKSRDGTITSWNPGAERLYGYAAVEAIGRKVAALLVPEELRSEQSEMTRRAFAGESINRTEIERVRKDGSHVLVALTITPVRNAAGKIVSAATVARDVSERRRYEDRLQYLAAHDHLTALLNRRSFEEALERELERAARELETGALLSIDLDQFKELNDIAGHAAGDILLTRVARALTANTRGTDVVARLGGDEFAVLLPNTGLARARAVAAKLLDAVHTCSVQVDNAPFRATASIGVATLVPGESRVYDLIVAADMAMYAAKQSGRDRIATFSASEAQSARSGLRRSWQLQIRHALEHGEMQLFRQPIVDLGSGKISHSELLLRMRRDDELILPSAFLAPAERSGLIHAIDHWVVQAAVALLLNEPPDLRRPVSINLSGVSVAGDPELLGLIRSELDVAGIDPALMIFEITETAAISNIGEARAFAEGVRAIGCRIALDDFGTGFGSFYHLKHLPIDYIKIDHEFIHDVATSALDQRIVSAVVEIATGLGVETVAESVGDDGTVRVLRDLGVDYGQGFHLGRPVPLDDFV